MYMHYIYTHIWLWANKIIPVRQTYILRNRLENTQISIRMYAWPPSLIMYLRSIVYSNLRAVAVIACWASGSGKPSTFLPNSNGTFWGSVLGCMLYIRPYINLMPDHTHIRTIRAPRDTKTLFCLKSSRPPLEGQQHLFQGLC